MISACVRFFSISAMPLCRRRQHTFQYEQHCECQRSEAGTRGRHLYCQLGNVHLHSLQHASRARIDARFPHPLPAGLSRQVPLVAALGRRGRGRGRGHQYKPVFLSSNVLSSHRSLFRPAGHEDTGGLRGVLCWHCAPPHSALSRITTPDMARARECVRKDLVAAFENRRKMVPW